MSSRQHPHITETIKKYLTKPQRRLIKDITKLYPDHAKVIEFKVDISINVNGSPVPKGSATPENQEQNEERNGKRAESEVYDIVMSNDFTHFVTFTLDPKKVKNRYDVGHLKLMLHRWLEKQRKLHGRFGYVIVAERHKDGAIHFHAVLAGFKGHMRDSGVKHNGKPVYNLPGWTYGFSTAKLIDQTPESRSKTARYVAKYITKDTTVPFAGAKRYWCSQGLNRPPKLYNDHSENRQNKIYCATRRIAYENERCIVYEYPFTSDKPPLSD